MTNNDKSAEKLYDQYGQSRYYEALGDHYARHIMAMTAEGLHSKSNIAAELAWRDQQIERLRTALKKSAAVLSGEAMSKGELIAALEAARAALAGEKHE